MINVKRALGLLVVATVSTLCLVLHAQERAAGTQDALARFPVAHEHNGSWCLGYLYIYPDSVAYETTWPASYKSHSFKLQRSDLKDVSRWLRAGQSLKAVEIRSGKSSYHFWWLANEQDVVSGRPYQKDPSDAGDPDPFIAAIRDPASLTADPGPPAQVAGEPNSTTASQLQQLPDSPLASGLAGGSPAAQPISAASEKTRFAVAHAHALTYCVGYLYVTPGSVRYEVVQPTGDKKHSFNVPRTDITDVRQWVLAGQVRNAAEIRTAHGSYHFWLLPDGSDLANTPYRQWNANSLAPIQPLIAAFQTRQ